MWTRFKEEFYWEYSWNLRRSTPKSCVPTRNRVVRAIGVAYFILGNSYQGRICATDVARWDTSFRTITRLRGKVLVHLEGNDGRTRVKRNHQSCLRHVGSPYVVVMGWVTRCLFIHQPIVFCFVFALALWIWT
jgi:hypothetical protein